MLTLSWGAELGAAVAAEGAVTLGAVLTWLGAVVGLVGLNEPIEGMANFSTSKIPPNRRVVSS